MHKIETTRQGGVGLPNGMLVAAGKGLEIGKAEWDQVKDHVVIKAMIDDGTLVVDRRAAKPQAGERDANGDTPEMAAMRKQFDASYGEVAGRLKAVVTAFGDTGVTEANVEQHVKDLLAARRERETEIAKLAAPAALTPAELLAKADELHFQTFKAEARKVLGDETPDTKEAIVTALQAKV